MVYGLLYIIVPISQLTVTAMDEGFRYGAN